MRTTIDIDTPLLDELRTLGQQEGKSLGRLGSDLLATALATRRSRDNRRGAEALDSQTFVNREARSKGFPSLSTPASR